MNKQDKIQIANYVAQLLFVLAGFAVLIALNSCTLTINPDGSRTYGTDANAAPAIATTIIEGSGK